MATLTVVYWQSLGLAYEHRPAGYGELETFLAAAG